MKELITKSLVALSLISLQGQAAIVDTVTPAPITSLYSYSDYGGGDVIFSTATTVIGCENGF
jgi:hypothetical protein